METESTITSILYMTVNTVNNKIYIGVHITETPYEFDNYWGDGITGTSSYWFKHPKYPFLRACKKYGLDAFRRYTLAVFNTYEEALLKEKEIVNEEFLKRSDVYNVALGGGSGLIPSVEKEIHQYDLEGKYITTYRSQSEAARKLNVTTSLINHAVLYKSICKNNYFSETRKAKIEVSNYLPKRHKKVHLYNKNFSYYKTFESIADACRWFEVTQSIILRAIKFQNLYKNYYISFDKKDTFLKTVNKHNRSKYVYKYDLDGNFLEKILFSDIKDSTKNKLHHAIRENYSWKGFLWSNEFKESVKPLKKSIKKRIYLYDLEGNLIKVWDSYTECRNHFSLLRAVLNGVRNNIKGYTFKYEKIELL